MNKGLIVLLVVAAIALPLYFFWPDIQTVLGNAPAGGGMAQGKEKKHKDKKDGKKGDKEGKKDKGKNDTSSPGIGIEEKWELPPDLTEISGVCWLADNRFACIQDELGKIFIYSTASNKVEKVIPFGGNGDYEGIALAGDNAYVVRADGTLFEVTGYNSGKPSTKQYVTGLTEKQDVEGLCHDAKNNRLLLAIKGEEPGNPAYKGIYAFDLATKKLAATPVYRIDLAHEIFKDMDEKKQKDIMQPSDIALHPQTGELYLTEGTKPKLLLLDSGGTPKKLYRLSSADFPQPEGLTFNSSGTLFISSEGKDAKGSLNQVTLAP